ncbi:MAG: FxsA family protein [Actinomycetota bacterium]|nr:FxsA family protein [Actinomycetota bacterium]
MLFLFLLLAWPIAELFVAIEVANAIGVLWTILLLIAGWPIGTWALRSQGRLVWRRFALAVSEGRPPAGEVIDGALVLVGGGLLITPGFITDALGLLMLLPPTRAGIRALVVRNFRSRLMARAVRFTPAGRDYDVEATATDIDQPHLGA